MSNATQNTPPVPHRLATISSLYGSVGYVQTTDRPEGFRAEFNPFPPNQVEVLAVVGEWAMVQDAGPPQTIPAFGHWGTQTATLMRVPFVVQVSKLVFEDQAAAPESTCAA